MPALTVLRDGPEMNYSNDGVLVWFGLGEVKSSPAGNLGVSKLREWTRKKRRGTNLKLLFSNMICGEPCWVAVLVLKLPGSQEESQGCHRQVQQGLDSFLTWFGFGFPDSRALGKSRSEEKMA
jgi:hypothetical protein